MCRCQRACADATCARWPTGKASDRRRRSRPCSPSAWRCRWPYKLIADLRFGLFELYDLARRSERAPEPRGEEPETPRRAARAGLRAGSTPRRRARPASAATSASEQAWQRALSLGDVWATDAPSQPMSSCCSTPKAPSALRVEAGQILAKLADPSCAPALRHGPARPSRSRSPPRPPSRSVACTTTRARDALRESDARRRSVRARARRGLARTPARHGRRCLR